MNAALILSLKVVIFRLKSILLCTMSVSGEREGYSALQLNASIFTPVDIGGLTLYTHECCLPACVLNHSKIST